MVKDEIKNVVKDYTVDGVSDLRTSKQMLWEVLKLRIRGITIPYCASLKRDRIKKEAELEDKLKSLEQKLSLENSRKDEIITEINEHKEDLIRLRESQIRNTQLQVRAREYCDSEKPTKFFCNLEKRNSIKKTVHKITVKDKIITDQKEILGELKNFYENLLTSKQDPNTIGEKFLNKDNINKLTELDRLQCEGQISNFEVKQVLLKMENGKSPGTDGFTTEFYKFFWNDIGTFVINSINDSFCKGELSITQKQGLISLIPKGNKQRDLIKNWRPITLLNIDYKLLSGALANRLKKYFLI